MRFVDAATTDIVEGAEPAGGRAQSEPTVGKRAAKFEWPTIVLFALVYTSWLGIIYWHADISLWIMCPALTLLVTLHSSLQHEALHGHPFRNCIANMMLAGVPLGLFIPYMRFKRLHLRHHCDENLTDPYDDPESFYCAQADWHALPTPLRRLLMLNNTLLGRLTVGPALSLYGFYRDELLIVFRRKADTKRVIAAWGLHAVGMLVVVSVLILAQFPLLLYIGAVAYTGMAVLMLRTYAEHQAARGEQPKTAIVEASPFFALLFLNNNLHCVHHKFPTAPWYRLPRLYRQYFLQADDPPEFYQIAGYGSLFAAFAIKMRQPVQHPFLRLTAPSKDRPKR